ILVGINLRPFLTGPGPVIDNIIASTAMSYSQVSLLTLLPMILMGVGALVVPFLQSNIQARRGLQVAMLILLLA
ncbi:MFS transporter, partial [Proteus mirabilis]|nr:MFS transporter [Proteus mirabilis]